ncbi:hypothetical protein [Methylobacterium brachiatum]
MAKEVKLTVTLEAALAAQLGAAAAERGWSAESLAAACVAQHLEVAIRHRVLVERMEQIDGAILDMAEAVGELGAPSASIDLSKVCRLRKDDGVADPTP